MAGNFLEQLVAEWYEYRGYFVRRNVRVGKLPAGGFEGELDVVAFHPDTKQLVHIESSMDAHSWDKREQRFTKKFKAGKKYIRSLFSGIGTSDEIEQIALFGGMSKAGRSGIGGGKVVFASDLIIEILTELKNTSMTSQAIPENFTILRALQHISMPLTRKKIILMWNCDGPQ